MIFNFIAHVVGSAIDGLLGMLAGFVVFGIAATAILCGLGFLGWLVFVKFGLIACLFFAVLALFVVCCILTALVG